MNQPHAILVTGVGLCRVVVNKLWQRGEFV